VLVLSVGVGCVLVPTIRYRTSECARVSCGEALRARGGGERAAPEVYASTLVQRQEVPAPRGSATGTEGARRVEHGSYYGRTFLTLFSDSSLRKVQEGGA
jgi:hypothetical protein